VLRILFLIISILFALPLPAQDAAVGRPVMSPGLNAYVFEIGEKSYKALFNTGLMHVSSASNSKNYLMLGGSFYLSKLSVFEPGFYVDMSLGGHDENIFATGTELRLHFIPITFFEVLYIKGGIGFLRYHSGLYAKTNMETPFGAGFEVATGKGTIINMEYARRPVFFNEISMYIWDIMLSVGYAW
jgi:hypothetical protein